MPGVTIRPAVRGASFVSQYYRPSNNPLALAEAACPRDYKQRSELLGSSFGSELKSNILPAQNGLVNSAIQTYNMHHHLRIRPEDTWFAVLAQLSLYINAHADELRGKFMAHEGRMELETKFGGDSRYTKDGAGD